MANVTRNPLAVVSASQMNGRASTSGARRMSTKPPPPQADRRLTFASKPKEQNRNSIGRRQTMVPKPNTGTAVANRPSIGMRWVISSIASSSTVFNYCKLLVVNLQYLERLEASQIREISKIRPPSTDTSKSWFVTLLRMGSISLFHQKSSLHLRLRTFSTSSSSWSTRSTITSTTVASPMKTCAWSLNYLGMLLLLVVSDKWIAYWPLNF